MHRATGRQPGVENHVSEARSYALGKSYVMIEIGCEGVACLTFLSGRLLLDDRLGHRTDGESSGLSKVISKYLDQSPHTGHFRRWSVLPLLCP